MKCKDCKYFEEEKWKDFIDGKERTEGYCYVEPNRVFRNKKFISCRFFEKEEK